MGNTHRHIRNLNIVLEVTWGERDNIKEETGDTKCLGLVHMRKFKTRQFTNYILGALLQKEIEEESDRISHLLNMCTMVITDCEASHIQLHAQDIAIHHKDIQTRWQRVCQKSSERKQNLENTWQEWDELNGLLHHFEMWIQETDVRIRVTYTRSDVLSHADACQNCSMLRLASQDILNHLDALEGINQKYSRL